MLRLIVLLSLGAFLLPTPSPATARRPDEPPISPHGGAVRVLVELRVTTPEDARAIADAQRGVLARLAGTRASVVRQYKSVPLLALQVDAGALARLEQMNDLVVRVVADSPVRSQDLP